MRTRPAREETEALAERLRAPAYGYREVRVLDDDVIIALYDLMYTRAILVDCDSCGYSRRFCFEDRKLADKEFAKLKTGEDEPVGFVARRPERIEE